MTILHCGLNGVQESLYTTVFLLCVYHMVIDYFEVAARLEHAKVGIPLYSAIVTEGGQGVFSRDDGTSNTDHH